MDVNLNNIVSASDIQKNYRKIFNQAKKTKKPIVVMRGNKAEVAVLDIKTLEDLHKRIAELELQDALLAIQEGDTELKLGKTKTAASLADLV